MINNYIVLVFLFLILSFTQVNAQINAITESGDEVILYDNNTWEYLNDSIYEVVEIELNLNEFNKDKKSSFLVKSKRVDFGIWINPKTWGFTKGDDAETIEYNFKLKGEDLHALMICERLEIPIESLREVAIQNAKSAATGFKLVKEEFRMVNGIKVLMLQMTGGIQGIEFHYYGYYYSSEAGTVQLLSYTSENLFNEYEEDIERFLNGFVSLN